MDDRDGVEPVIPDGAQGPFPMINGQGIAYRGGHGGGELHPTVSGVIFMRPLELRPEGYFTYIGPGVGDDGPDAVGSTADTSDPGTFERFVRSQVEEQLREHDAATFRLEAVILEDSFPWSRLVVRFHRDDLPYRRYAYWGPIWETMAWYQLRAPDFGFTSSAFASDFVYLMFDDLERGTRDRAPDRRRRVGRGGRA